VPSPARMFGSHIPIPIPPEFADESTFLAHLGLGAAELKKIWWYRSRMYQQFSIAKGAGKLRLISAPDRRLNILQSKLTPLLNQLYRIRKPVHGFVPARSVKTNAEAHGQRRFVVNLDLQDFFPTITENRIRGLLQALGVNYRVSAIIARLCCLNDHLPQGAPTSPVLSNMICFRLDTDLLEIAKGARAIYTRYADDISFSSYQPPAPLFEGALPAVGRFSPEVLAPRLREAFLGNGFAVNPDKAHYADRNSRRIITGVKINAGLNVDRRYVRNIRAVLHSIEETGLIDAQAKYVSKGGRGFLAAYLRGKISYIAFLKGRSDPVARSLAIRYNNCFPTDPIRVAPTREEIHDRATWVVEHSKRQGTAFFLEGVGLVTAAHCVKNRKTVTLFHPSKHTKTFTATVRMRDDHRDLAILDHQIPATDYLELRRSVSHPKKGDPVTALGYPKWGPVDHLNARPGVVTLVTIKSAVRLIEVDQTLTQGMSGGPLIDAQSGVIGVIHRGGPGQGRDFAVHIQVLEEWLKAEAAAATASQA
jgi:RNA-directed DNA polymerase